MSSEPLFRDESPDDELMADVKQPSPSPAPKKRFFSADDGNESDDSAIVFLDPTPPPRPQNDVQAVAGQSGRASCRERVS